MNIISEEFKRSLPQKSSGKDGRPSSARRETEVQQRQEAMFLHLFQSLNPSKQQPSVGIVTVPYQSSFIDTVMIQHSVELHEGKQLKLIQQPTIIPLQSSTAKRIEQIIQFFNPTDEQTILIADQPLDFEAYSHALLAFGRKLTKKKKKKLEEQGKSNVNQQKNNVNQFKNNESQQRSIETQFKSGETQFKSQGVEMEQERENRMKLRSDNQQKEMYFENKGESDSIEMKIEVSEERESFRKADIILLDILREKKRKKFSKDYLEGMERKLLELFEYVLRGEEMFMGLDLRTKIERVLANLEHFKGRMVDGESKLKLLHIFFSDFRTLKEELKVAETPRPKDQWIGHLHSHPKVHPETQFHQQVRSKGRQHKQ